MSWSSLGPTHHTTEDIAVLRSIPNLVILSPSTPKQVKECVQAAYEHVGPVYIRIGMNKEKEFFPDDYSMCIGQNDVLKNGGDISIFTTGSILEEVHGATESLNNDGIAVNLVNVASVKPLDQENILNMAHKSKMIFVVEEHNVHGGLGSAIAEFLTEKDIVVPLHRIGLPDAFAQGYGTHASVRKENGLDAMSIYKKIKELL